MKMKVCVVGLGVVGLPTATYISKYHPVWGYDINPSKIDEAKQQQIRVASCWEEIPQDIEVYILCVSTSLSKGLPNVRPVFDVCSIIKERASGVPLVSIESTVCLGTCRRVYNEIFGGSVNLAHVPHRFWSTDPVNYGVKQIRVMGAVDEASKDRALRFYKSINIPLWSVSTVETAELSKIAENSLRFVEISFAEQLCMIAEKNGVDFEELRQACNTLFREFPKEEYRVQILEARDGIGGNCLPKDIRYLISLAGDSPLLKGAILTDWHYLKGDAKRMKVRRDFVLNKEAYKVRPMSTSYFHKNFFVRLIENLRVREVCKQVEEWGPGIVLDVGCEEGYVASKLQSPSYLIGLDFQREPLKEAKKRFDDVVCGDAQYLPFKNKSVGCVICSEVLEHVDDPLVALREICRVTSYLILSIPHERKILFAKKLLVMLGFRSLLGQLEEEMVPEHLHSFSKGCLISMLKRNFIIEKIVSIPSILGLKFVLRIRTIQVEEELNH